MRFSLTLLIILVLSACAKPDGFLEEVVDANVLKEGPGAFFADIKPINKRLTGRLKGKAKIVIRGIQFYVRIKFEGKHHRIFHMQFLHSGRRCPDMSADVNGDGIIDIDEIQSYSGKFILSLGDDFFSRTIEQFNLFLSDEEGKYDYSKAVSITKLKEYLSFTSVVGKYFSNLGVEEKLDIKNRTVVIYGVAENPDIPASVKPAEHLPRHLSIPIACGEFKSSPL